jgi:hypothetical protein
VEHIDANLSQGAIGLRLCRMTAKDNLVLYEDIFFPRGRPAVEVILRRASICGQVKVDGDLQDHWADVITDKNGDWDQTVSLDPSSFRYLKNRMRPLVARN